MLRPKCGGAVMLITNPDKFEGMNEPYFEFMGSCTSLTNENILDFFSSFSKAILKSNEAKEFPDLITLGFFCRRANIKRALTKVQNLNYRLGWGTAVHIAPSNIPMNFAFSFFISLLSGNTNIVRLPSKEFPQVELFLNKFEELTNKKKFKTIGEKNFFVRTHRDSNLLDQLIYRADILIIWGGNETVQAFRTKDRKAKSIEVSFPNKISSVIIGSKNYLNLSKNEQDVLTTNFYNDTFLVDQNACSSPSKVFWLGSADDNKSAKSLFWDQLEQRLNASDSLHPVSRMDKMLDIMKYNAKNEQALWKIDLEKNLWVIPLYEKVKNPESLKGRLGMFFEKEIKELSETVRYISDVEQTISYHGILAEDLRKIIIQNEINGVDRIVPIGKALDMGFIWDGHNLLTKLSREISLI